MRNRLRLGPIKPAPPMGMTSCEPGDRPDRPGAGAVWYAELGIPSDHRNPQRFLAREWQRAVVLQQHDALSRCARRGRITLELRQLEFQTTAMIELVMNCCPAGSETAAGPDSLIWPRGDGLIWPHLA